MTFNSVLRSVAVSVSLVAVPSVLYAQPIPNNNQDRFSAAPAINIGGFINSNAGFRSQDGDYTDERLPDAEITAGAVSDTNPGTHNRMTNNPDLTNEAEVHIKVAGINEFGMKYGAIIELEANTSSAARNEGVNADKAYIFTESRLGKMEFGNNSSVNHKMKVGPETFARGAGGINGKYLEYINMPMLADSTQLRTASNQIGNCNGYRVSDTGVITQTGTNCAQVKLPRFILIPQSPIAHGGYAKGFYNRTGDNDYSTSPASTAFGFNKNKSDSQVRDGQFGDLEDATKISYYTPRISGWQFGVTFTPDTGNGGTSAAISGDNSGDVKQAVGYGINYSENFGNVGLALSATGETGQAEQSELSVTKRNDLQAYDVGAMMTFFGITIGASYGNWGDSLQPKNGIYSCNYDPTVTLANQTCAGTTGTSGSQTFDDATYQTAGIAYQFGPFASSLTYIQSNFQENTYNAVSFGIDYRMAKGLMPYIEVTQYKFESNQPKYDVGGSVVDQSNFANSDRQLRDNEGYVALAGLLFSF